MIIETIERLSIDVFVTAMAITAVVIADNRSFAFGESVLPIIPTVMERKETYIEILRLNIYYVETKIENLRHQSDSI